jgi:hypothetical protein
MKATTKLVSFKFLMQHDPKVAEAILHLLKLTGQQLFSVGMTAMCNSIGDLVRKIKQDEKDQTEEEILDRVMDFAMKVLKSNVMDYLKHYQNITFKCIICGKNYFEANTDPDEVKICPTCMFAGSRKEDKKDT